MLEFRGWVAFYCKSCFKECIHIIHWINVNGSESNCSARNKLKIIFSVWLIVSIICYIRIIGHAKENISNLPEQNLGRIVGCQSNAPILAENPHSSSHFHSTSFDKPEI